MQLSPPNWPRLIYEYRSKLNLSQEEFGKLFEVSGVAVHKWETGKAEAPYKVTWCIYQWLLSPDNASLPYEKKEGEHGND